MVEPINYNGVDGVFIPANEFEYMKTTIKKNGELLNQLLNKFSEENPTDLFNILDSFK